MRSIPAWAGEPILATAGASACKVYPRVGGGTDCLRVPIGILSGLSPRGRGNLLPDALDGINYRSIPAWAGEPSLRRRKARMLAVYPRVGGGTPSVAPPGLTPAGLSPRGRGNHPGGGRAGPVRRSIPAWAGEPYRGGPGLRHAEVYPRVGGGTLPGAGARRGLVGLSPRGRGNRGPFKPRHETARSIPAWAGEPPLAGGLLPGLPVYPRVGGGTAAKMYELGFPVGLSPRGRGNPLEEGELARGHRSIPAWAGEPLTLPRRCFGCTVYPRVGGGTSLTELEEAMELGLSPRGRGNQGQTAIL